MTRFLQGAFPDARFLMVVRHPAVVSLSTRKWARRRPLGTLLDHWFAAHRRLEQDAAFLRRLLVVKYEHLVADPQGTLASIAAFLELEGEIPADGIDPAAAPPTSASGPAWPPPTPGAASTSGVCAAATSRAPTTSATACSTWAAPTPSRSARLGSGDPGPAAGWAATAPQPGAARGWTGASAAPGCGRGVARGQHRTGVRQGGVDRDQHPSRGCARFPSGDLASEPGGDGRAGKPQGGGPGAVRCGAVRGGAVRGGAVRSGAVRPGGGTARGPPAGGGAAGGGAAGGGTRRGPSDSAHAGRAGRRCQLSCGRGRAWRFAGV